MQNILSFFANCLSKKCISDNKGKLLFRFGQGKWIDHSPRKVPVEDSTFDKFINFNSKLYSKLTSML